MEMTTIQDKRDAKRADTERRLRFLVEELDDAKTVREQQQATVEKIKAAITKTNTEITYRTAPGRAALDAKAEALARVALGTADLDEARSIEGGGHSEMTLTELNTSLTGLKVALKEAESELHYATSKLKAVGTKVLEAKAALMALTYDERVDGLVSAWADLLAISKELEVRRAQPHVWHQTWALLRVPHHTSTQAHVEVSDVGYVEARGELCGNRLYAAERRIKAEIDRLGVDA